jgi:hypothetical protein
MVIHHQHQYRYEPSEINTLFTQIGNTLFKAGPHFLETCGNKRHRFEDESPNQVVCNSPDFVFRELPKTNRPKQKRKVVKVTVEY